MCCRGSLVSEVTNLIRQLIEEQDLSTGDRLPSESEFLRKHQVRRSVLREAIRQLEAIGLIEVCQGQGMFVGGRDVLAICVHIVRRYNIAMDSRARIRRFANSFERRQRQVIAASARLEINIPALSSGFASGSTR
jgi:DNA-binding GntR family transcriptional regulator